MHARQWIIAGIVASLAGAAAIPVSADDTEIYLAKAPDEPSQPLVMFTLDYRPNVLGEVFCSDTSPTKCESADYFRSEKGGNLPESDIPKRMTFLDIIRLSLKVVLTKTEQPLRVGLMTNHNNDEKCIGPSPKDGKGTALKCSNGGYVARRFRSTTEEGSVDELNKILGAMSQTALGAGGAIAHPYQGAELFFEFHRYLTGGDVYNGHNGWADFGTDTKQNIDVDHASHDWDAHPEIEKDSKYVSPLLNIDNCTKIFTINLLFQVSQQDAAADFDIKASTSAGGLGLTFAKNRERLTQVVEYLNDSDVSAGVSGVQSVTSYFLSKDPLYKGNTLTEYAEAGDTKRALELAADPEKLILEFERIFSEILSVSTTFVASSVPVNVFNRAEIIDNIFLALFQPSTSPLWIGNLKKLRFADSPAGTLLVDSLSSTTSAVGNDGRIDFDALTWWSRYAGTPSLMAPGDGNSDGIIDPTIDNGFQTAEQKLKEPIIPLRDGRHVFRGAAGQNIPGFAQSPAVAEPFFENAKTNARQIYFDGADGNLVSDLDATRNVAESMGLPVGAAGSAEEQAAIDLLAFIRGYNHVDTTGDGVLDTYKIRPWLFGAPLHSRPVAINYGKIETYSEDRPGIFIALASNDGFIRLIENTTAGGTPESASNQSGRELWAFMPKAVLPAQKFMQRNTPLTDAENPNSGPGITVPAPIPYSMDASPTVLILDKNGNGTIEGTIGDADGDRVILFAGMQRGGYNYYALDITDPRKKPKLLWTIKGGSGDFKELGLTFSEARTGRVRVGTQLKDAIFFGGGYSKNKDRKIPSYSSADDDTIGNAIYVVEALTGKLIWKATGDNGGQTTSPTNFVHGKLLDSIPSNLTIADTDGDTSESIDRLLVGDTGGNVWRADLVSNDVSKWTLTLLATLGRHAGSGKAEDRRFFHEPDIVQDRDAKPFDAVIIGSGDRQDPLDVGGPAQNYMFLVKDRNIGVGSVDSGSFTPFTVAGLPDVTCVEVPTGSQQAVPCDDPDLASGWKLRLNIASSDVAASEKSLSTPLTFNRKIFFTTYLPPGSSPALTCGPAEGSGLFYAINLDDATPAYNFNSADGGTATNPNSASDRSDALASGGIPAQVVFLPPGDILRPDLEIEDVGEDNRYRTFWRRRED